MQKTHSDQESKHTVKDGYVTYNLTDAQYEHYQTCIDNGCSNRTAIMLCTATPPGCKTEDSFKGNFAANGGQFGGSERTEIFADRAVKQIQKRNPQWSPKGKVHMGSLGPITDEGAWVDRMTARSDIKKRCEERNLNCHGMVEHEAREIEPVQGPPVAPKLVKREARKMLANPECKLSPGEACEAAAEKMAPPKPEAPPSEGEMKAAMNQLAKVAKGGD